MADTRSDSYWTDAATFVRTHLKPGDRLIAPNQLKKEFANVEPYASADVADVARCQWAVIHKGTIDQLDHTVLSKIVDKLTPVFANEVFVVFSSYQNIALETPNSFHMNAFWEQVDPRRVVDNNPLSRFKKQIVRTVKTAKNRIAPKRETKTVRDRLPAVLKRLDRLEKTVNELEKNSRKPALIYTNKNLAAMSLPEFTIACRAVCQTMYLGNETALCRILGKHLLYVDTTDIGIAPHLSLNGYWEPGITLVTARLLQPGWHCIDVGANHGYFSILMANAVGSSGRVVALEPNPKLVKLLQKGIELNGFESYTSVIPKAASAQDGEQLHLYIPDNQTGHASLVSNPASFDNIITVETITLDTLTHDWPQVNVVKIDAEGAEEIIWRGMRETIRKNKDIIVFLEFGATRYPDPKSFLLEIQQEGFVLRHIEGVDIKELTIEQCLTERLDSFWMLFLQRSQVEDADAVS